jgi:hypothetical protein
VIWIIKGDESYQINALNVTKRNNNFELWITRSDGSGLKILQDKDEGIVKEYKEAIDFAIKEGKNVFKIE